MQCPAYHVVPSVSCSAQRIMQCPATCIFQGALNRHTQPSAQRRTRLQVFIFCMYGFLVAKCLLCAHVCVHVFACICMWVSMCAYAFFPSRLKCLHTNVFVLACAQLPACTSPCMHLNVYECVCVRVCVFVCMQLPACASPAPLGPGKAASVA